MPRTLENTNPVSRSFCWVSATILLRTLENTNPVNGWVSASARILLRTLENTNPVSRSFCWVSARILQRTLENTNPVNRSFCWVSARILQRILENTYFTRVCLDLNAFWHVLRKSTKWRPGSSIWTLSGICSRSRPNGFLTSFCRLLGPRLESAQTESPARHFVDFWSQGQKVLKCCQLFILLRFC